jgi:glycosyltransferase involved in cell wall biosynthesis
MMNVAALVPAYQAAPWLGDVLARLQALERAPHVLVVDDGSRDATAQVARAAGVQLISFAGNRGKGAALRAGFEALRAFDAVVTLDADGQHPPECLPAFVRAAEDGADVVLGARQRSGSMPPARRFANGFSSAWSSAISGRRIRDSQCGFRLFRRAVLERTPLSGGRYEVESEMAVRAARLGFRFAEVLVPTVYAGESHLTLMRDVPRIFIMMIRLTVERVAPPDELRRALREDREHA